MRRVVLMMAVLAGWGFTGQKVTYVDLVKRLTDLEALAVLPEPGEKCAQFSSYDRHSRYDPKTGKYVAWTANGDGSGIIRREGDKQVLAEIKGPAVIWRIWSAMPQKGHVRVFLDGATAPTIDLPFHNYFDGKVPPFQGKALCHVLARGWNCYVPIPFQKSCRVVADRGWGRYYHFTYTTYPPGTELPTFSMKLSRAELDALARANDFLEKKLGTDPAGPRPGERAESVTVEARPRSTAKVIELRGPRAITALRVSLKLPEAPDDIRVLRELCLRITWDDEPKAAVWSPLGDFFGAAPGLNNYRSLPLGVTDDGFYCFWHMPFATRALVELVNDGDQERSVEFRITHAPLSKPLASLGRFHARWHRDAFLPAEPERRAIDWTIVKTKGRGRFVGVMLHIWNPRGGWWGEGDEKFFVDGEKFPSTFGTGSEDYFGYAWGCPQKFENAFHDQPHNDGGNRGHVCVNRWHITDNGPFQTSFEAAIEKYYKNNRPTLYAAVAYWYLAPGQAEDYPEVPLAERTGYYKPPPSLHVKGAIEGERLRIVEKTAGNARPQNLDAFGPRWSGMSHLWWTDAKPGDKLTVEFPVKDDGRYKLILQLTKARDYGIVQLHLDGQKLGQPLDLYNPNVVPTGKLDMGIHQLKKGSHRLTIEIVGANPKAIKAYMAGLDYLKLDPAE